MAEGRMNYERQRQRDAGDRKRNEFADGYDKPPEATLSTEEAMTDVEKYLAEGNQIQEVPRGMSGLMPDGRVPWLGRKALYAGQMQRARQAAARSRRGGKNK